MKFVLIPQDVLQALVEYADEWRLGGECDNDLATEVRVVTCFARQQLKSDGNVGDGI